MRCLKVNFNERCCAFGFLFNFAVPISKMCDRHTAFCKRSVPGPDNPKLGRS